MSRDFFYGYRREDGRVGIRDFPLVVAAMDNANPVARRIAALVKGAVPIVAAYGRGQKGEDLRVHDQTLVNYGAHPNASCVLVVSLEQNTARALAEPIGETGKPVDWVDVQTCGGTLKATEVGVRRLNAMIASRKATRREKVGIEELVIGLECGGSDAVSGMTGNSTLGIVSDRIVAAGGTAILSEPEEIIGAEHLLAERAATPKVAKDLLEVVARWEAYARYVGMDMAPLGGDNIEGGLSTTEEKSLGAVRKGGTSPLRQVIGMGTLPTEKGLVFLDAPGPGTENTTSLAAAGAQLILFSTGIGNPIGNPLAPTIKITGSPETAVTFADNIDVSVAGIIEGTLTLPQAADKLMGHMLAVAEGFQTASERLGDTEITISRVENGFLKLWEKGYFDREDIRANP